MKFTLLISYFDNNEIIVITYNSLAEALDHMNNCRDSYCVLVEGKVRIWEQGYIL